MEPPPRRMRSSAVFFVTLGIAIVGVALLGTLFATCAGVFSDSGGFHWPGG